MVYKGKLYGKIGNKYFDTGHTTDDYNDLINRVEELDKIVEKKLSAHKVVEQSEQLKAFVKWRNVKDSNWLRRIDEKDVDDYLKSL